MVTPAYEDPAEWMLKEGDLPVNVTPEEFEAQGSRGAPPLRPGLRPRPDHAVGLHPAGAGAGSRRRPAGAGARRSGSCAAAFSTWFPATARSASACRSASCRMSRRRTIPTPTSSTRRCRAEPLPDFRNRARARAGRAAAAGERQPRPADGAFHRRRDRPADPGRAGARRGRRRRPHRALGRAARRAALRLHAAGRVRSRTISTCSPPPRLRPRRWACRSTSRATRRRPTRG